MPAKVAAKGIHAKKAKVSKAKKPVKIAKKKPIKKIAKLTTEQKLAVKCKQSRKRPKLVPFNLNGEPDSVAVVEEETKKEIGERVSKRPKKGDRNYY